MKIFIEHDNPFIKFRKLFFFDKFLKYSSNIEILLSLILLILFSTFIYIIKTISELPFSQQNLNPCVEGNHTTIDTKDKKKILILTSYHLGYSWSDDEIKGLTETLNKYADKIEYFIEFLDAKRWPTIPYTEELLAIFRYKYKDKKLNLIIVLDNPALEFVLEHDDKLFKDLPIVFCGINGFKIDMLRGRKNVSGIAETFDVEQTIELALKINPKLQDIYVLHDYSITGLSSRQNIASQLMKYSNRLKINFFENLSINEIISRLQLLSSTSVVLAISYSIDKDGNVFDHPRISKILGQYSPVPVYVVHSERVGHGVLGGYVLEGKRHGQIAGEIAIKKLLYKNYDNSESNFYTKSEGIWMFDYKILRKFNINQSLIPNNSIIVNKPFSILDLYPEFSLKAWLIFLVTLTCLVILIMFIIIKKPYERHIIISEYIFRNLFNSLKDMVFVISKTGEIIRVNSAVEEFLEYKTEEILYTKFEDYLQQNNFKNIFSKIINETPWEEKEFIMPFERYSFITKSKKEIPVELTFSQITLDNEIALLISARDLREKLKVQKYKAEFEEQLINSQKIEIINFITSEISQNLSKFLTQIIGYAELAINLTQRNVSIEKYLLRIKDISLKANTIFKNLLYFCQNLPQENNISYVNVNNTIEKLLSIFSNMFYTNIDFRFCRDNNTLIASISQNHLEQILANIIFNAIDSMPKGGTITISTSILTLETDKEIKSTNRILQAGNYIVIEIDDTGEGIPKEIESRIFEPFFTTKTQQFHPGLGLTIALSLALKYSGGMDFISELNKGTKFFIYLPSYNNS